MTNIRPNDLALLEYIELLAQESPDGITAFHEPGNFKDFRLTVGGQAYTFNQLSTALRRLLYAGRIEVATASITAWADEPNAYRRADRRYSRIRTSDWTSTGKTLIVRPKGETG